MLKISRLADYGLILMHVLAKNKSAKLSAKQLADVSNIPLPTVSKLLKLLSEAGLVDALRGVQGGYRLGRTPDVISIAQVLAAIDGSGVALTECVGAGGACSLMGHCELQGHWHYINDQVSQLLSRISLLDMQKPMQLEAVHG